RQRDALVEAEQSLAGWWLLVDHDGDVRDRGAQVVGKGLERLSDAPLEVHSIVVLHPESVVPAPLRASRPAQICSYALSTRAVPRSLARRSAWPPVRNASTGSASRPRPVRSEPSSPRTSVSKAFRTGG